jgi:hypothetical protein
MPFFPVRDSTVSPLREGHPARKGRSPAAKAVENITKNRIPRNKGTLLRNKGTFFAKAPLIILNPE